MAPRFFRYGNTTDLHCTNLTTVQTCLVLSPDTPPAYAMTVAMLHIVTGSCAILCALGFISNVAVAHRVMVAMGSKEPTDKISFFVAPFLCVVFCFCSFVHGFSTFPVTSSSTYSDQHIGCECMAGVTVQYARFIMHSLVVPLILIVAFEQSYVIHKRKTAKFCCIGFDRGHRLKAKNFQVGVLSCVLRLSMWFVAGGLAVFNIVMNYNVMQSLDINDIRKQQRFTYKSLITNPQPGDLVEFCFLGIFTLYFGFSLWNYGKNYSMQMTAMPCNRWIMMLIGSFILIVSNLLPKNITPFTADASIVIYLTTVILLEKEVLKDMNSLEEYNMKKKSIDNGDLSASDDQLPDWANTAMFQHFQADTLKQITQQGDNEKNRPEEMPPTTDVKVDMNTGMMSNPMNAKNKLQRISSFTTKKK